MVSVGVHTAHSWIWTCEDDVINAVHIISQRASSIGGGPVESNGMLLCVDCPCAVFDYMYLLFEGNFRSRPEGVADFLVSKLIGWVVSFYTGSGGRGSGLYGMVEPLPAIVMVARDISRV
eukprot:610272-Pelagomonas_calceolata.AAC.1